MIDKETELTRKRYNRTSHFYDLMDRMIKPELREKAIKQASGKALEIGVGTGSNLALYKPGCEVTAIDLSPGMLEKAREKVKDARVPVQLLEMDAQNLQFEDDTFDTVVATCVFCSIPDPIKGLQEIRRVCKLNSKIILLEHVRSDNPILGLIMDALDPLTVHIGPHINRRTVENVKTAGLKVNNIENHYFKIMKLIVAKA